MSDRVEGLAILGLGLLGASVAAAARQRESARRIVGYDRDRTQTEFASAQGWIDATETSPARASRGADLVVLATPIAAMPDLLRAALPGLGDGAIVTDVGSVKSGLAATLPAALPDGVVYVGSHPMAGGHGRGARCARDDLFEGAVVIVTGAPSPARDRVAAFWGGLGAEIEFRSPGDHDLEVAWTSHLPHVLAFAFAGAFGDAPESAKRLTGAGFRDFTRIARSDPELWAGILTANAKALARPLRQSASVLEELATLLREAEGTEGVDGSKLESILARAGTTLRDLPESR